MAKKCVVQRDSENNIESVVVGNPDNIRVQAARKNQNPLDKAPNGKDSLLYQSLQQHGYSQESTELLIARTFTPEFMETFGDWLNDPQNAKIPLDENGQPKVVWVGELSKPKFNVYSNRIEDSRMDNDGFFTEVYDDAANYAYAGFYRGGKLDPRVQKMFPNSYLRPVFLQISNLREVPENNGIKATPVFDANPDVDGTYGRGNNSTNNVYAIRDASQIHIIEADGSIQQPEAPVNMRNTPSITIDQRIAKVQERISGIKQSAASLLERFGIPTEVVSKEELAERVRAKYKDLLFARNGVHVYGDTESVPQFVQDFASDLGFTAVAVEDRNYSIYLDNLTGVIYVNKSSQITQTDLNDILDSYGVDDTQDLKQALDDLIPEKYELMQIDGGGIGFVPTTVEELEAAPDMVDWNILSSSKDFNFTPELLEKYENKWDWSELSRNPSINFTPELIEKFENYWYWRVLSRNKELNLTSELLEKFENRWDWRILSRDPIIKFTPEIIEKFENKWDWYYLTENANINFTPELLEKYKDRWNWDNLSDNTNINFTPELVEKFEDKWNWWNLSGNHSVKFTPELLEKFKYEWDWSFLSKNPDINFTPELIEKFKNELDWEYLFKNPNINFTSELLEKYKDKWSWHYLTDNTNINFTPEVLEKFKDKWNWGFLSNKPNINFTPELLEKYKDRWNWDNLSANQGLNLTPELLEKYENKWNWWNLSGNHSVKFTPELLEKFKYEWDWSELSRNPSINFTPEILGKFRYEWDWWILSKNPSIHSTLELLEKFKDRLNWFYLASSKELTVTPELLEKYENKQDWHALSSNPNINFTPELLEKYKDKWSWSVLSKSSTINFTPELIEKFEDKWDWESLSDRITFKMTPEFIEKYGSELLESAYLHTRVTDNIVEYVPISIMSNLKLELSDSVLEKLKDKLIWSAVLHNNPGMIHQYLKLYENNQDTPSVKQSFNKVADVGLPNDSIVHYFPAYTYKNSNEITKYWEELWDKNITTTESAATSNQVVPGNMLENYSDGGFVVMNNDTNYLFYSPGDNNSKSFDTDNNRGLKNMKYATRSEVIVDPSSIKDSIDQGGSEYAHDEWLIEMHPANISYIQYKSVNYGVPNALYRLNQKYGIELRLTHSDGTTELIPGKNTDRRYFSRDTEGIQGYYDHAEKSAVIRSDAPMTTTIHEAFTHPFLEAAKTQNPELYNNLLTQASNNPKIKKAVDEAYSDKTQEERNDEYITHAVDMYVNKELEYTEYAGLRKAIEDFFKFISDSLRRILDIQTTVDQLPPDLTLKDLAQYTLYGTGQIDLTSSESGPRVSMSINSVNKSENLSTPQEVLDALTQRFTQKGLVSGIHTLSSSEFQDKLQELGVPAQKFIGARSRATFEDLIRKKNPSMSEEELKKSLDFLHELEDTKENTKLIKAVVKWLSLGNITLPYGIENARTALELATKNKVDPMQFKDPMHIINKYFVDMEYGSKIDPDTLDTFQNKRTIGTGESQVTIYDIVEDPEDSEKAQREACKVFYGAFGYSTKNSASKQPWCLGAFTRQGEPTQSAINFWNNTYTSVSKKIAFNTKGEPIAFMAHNESYEGDLWWNLSDSSSNNLPLEDGNYLDPEGNVEHEIRSSEEGDYFGEAYENVAENIDSQELYDIVQDYFVGNIDIRYHNALRDIVDGIIQDSEISNDRQWDILDEQLKYNILDEEEMISEFQDKYTPEEISELVKEKGSERSAMMHDFIDTYGEGYDSNYKYDTFLDALREEQDENIERLSKEYRLNYYDRQSILNYLFEDGGSWSDAVYEESDRLRDENYDSENTELYYSKGLHPFVGGFYNSKTREIYLNQDAEDPLSLRVHEFSHPVLQWLKSNHRDKFDAGVKVLKSNQAEAQSYIDHVKKYYTDLKPDSDAFNEEVLAHIIGDNGARLINSKKTGSIREWLESLWETFKNALGISGYSADQISKMTLGEFSQAVTNEMFNGNNIQKYTLKSLESKEFSINRGKNVSPQTVENLLKKQSVKQAERELMREVLDNMKTNRKKISYDEFENAVRIQIMPLIKLETDSYSEYGMNKIGDNYDSAKTFVYNAPVEHEVTGHFAKEYSIRYNLKMLDVNNVKVFEHNDNTYVLMENHEGPGYRHILETFNHPPTEDEIKKAVENDNIRRRELNSSSINRGLFGHTRVWTKGDVYNVSEIQSDVFQKENIKKSILENSDIHKANLIKKAEELKIIDDKMTNYALKFENSKWIISNERERGQRVIYERINGLGLPLGESGGAKVRKVPGENLFYEIVSADGKVINNTSYYGKESAQAKLDEYINTYKTFGKGREVQLEDMPDDLKEAYTYFTEHSVQDETKLEDKYKNIEDDSLNTHDKQFINSEKYFEIRLIRESVKDAAENGFKKFRIPMPYTISTIEGYINRNRDNHILEKDFDINSLHRMMQTVVKRYEYFGKTLEKERGKDNFRIVRDENGYPWYETDILEADRSNPVIAYSISEEQNPVELNSIPDPKVKGARMVQFGPTSIHFKEGPGFLELSLIQTEPGERGQGNASSALDQFLQYAESQNKKVKLDIVARDRSTYEARLAEFYEKHGFIQGSSDADFQRTWYPSRGGVVQNRDYIPSQLYNNLKQQPFINQQQALDMYQHMYTPGLNFWQNEDLDC